MYSMSIPALLALALFLPNHSNAQSITNPVTPKHAALKDAKAKLEGGIKGFLEAVNSCDLPVAVKTKIVDGFAGPANRDNALALLSVRESKVAELVSEADKKFDALTASCNGGASGFESQVAVPAEAVSKEAQDKIKAEFDLYKLGNAEASKNEATLRKILLLRQMTAPQPASDGCKKALSFLGEDGKNNGPLKETDKALQDSFAGLIAAYPERVASIREFGRVIVAGGRCGSSPQRVGMFPRLREGEYQVSDIPSDSSTESAL